MSVRRLLAAVAVAGVLAMSACGGGSSDQPADAAAQLRAHLDGLAAAG